MKPLHIFGCSMYIQIAQRGGLPIGKIVRRDHGDYNKQATRVLNRNYILPKALIKWGPFILLLSEGKIGMVRVQRTQST